jgi:predicted RNA-binding protein with PUA-like domain
MNWLFKEEPTHYNFDELVKDKKTVWSGVRNPLAQKHLRLVKKGDRIFYYHTGDEKAVKEFPLVRMSRLSVMPVTDAEWARIEKKAGGG